MDVEELGQDGGVGQSRDSDRAGGAGWDRARSRAGCGDVAEEQAVMAAEPAASRGWAGQRQSLGQLVGRQQGRDNGQGTRWAPGRQERCQAKAGGGNVSVRVSCENWSAAILLLGYL